MVLMKNKLCVLCALGGEKINRRDRRVRREERKLEKIRKKIIDSCLCNILR